MALRANLLGEWMSVNRPIVFLTMVVLQHTEHECRARATQASYWKVLQSLLHTHTC